MTASVLKRDPSTYKKKVTKIAIYYDKSYKPILV